MTMQLFDPDPEGTIEDIIIHDLLYTLSEVW